MLWPLFGLLRPWHLLAMSGCAHGESFHLVNSWPAPSWSTLRSPAKCSCCQRDAHVAGGALTRRQHSPKAYTGVQNRQQTFRSKFLNFLSEDGEARAPETQQQDLPLEAQKQRQHKAIASPVKESRLDSVTVQHRPSAGETMRPSVETLQLTVQISCQGASISQNGPQLSRETSDHHKITQKPQGSNLPFVISLGEGSQRHASPVAVSERCLPVSQEVQVPFNPETIASLQQCPQTTSHTMIEDLDRIDRPSEPSLSNPQRQDVGSVSINYAENWASRNAQPGRASESMIQGTLVEIRPPQYCEIAARRVMPTLAGAQTHSTQTIQTRVPSADSRGTISAKLVCLRNSPSHVLSSNWTQVYTHSRLHTEQIWRNACLFLSIRRVYCYPWECHSKIFSFLNYSHCIAQSWVSVFYFRVLLFFSAGNSTYSVTLLNAWPSPLIFSSMTSPPPLPLHDFPTYPPTTSSLPLVASKLYCLGTSCSCLANLLGCMTALCRHVMTSATSVESSCSCQCARLQAGSEVIPKYWCDSRLTIYQISTEDDVFSIGHAHRQLFSPVLQLQAANWDTSKLDLAWVWFLMILASTSSRSITCNWFLESK